MWMLRFKFITTVFWLAAQSGDSKLWRFVRFLVFSDVKWDFGQGHKDEHNNLFVYPNIKRILANFLSLFKFKKWLIIHLFLAKRTADQIFACEVNISRSLHHNRFGLASWPRLRSRSLDDDLTTSTELQPVARNLGRGCRLHITALSSASNLRKLKVRVQGEFMTRHQISDSETTMCEITNQTSRFKSECNNENKVNVLRRWGGRGGQSLAAGLVLAGQKFHTERGCNEVKPCSQNWGNNKPMSLKPAGTVCLGTYLGLGLLFLPRGSASKTHVLVMYGKWFCSFVATTEQLQFSGSAPRWHERKHIMYLLLVQVMLSGWHPEMPW